MKKLLILLTIQFLILVMSFGHTLAQTSMVQSTAGGSAESPNFTLVATVGQVSPADMASSNNFTLQSGFIYTLGLSSFENTSALFSLSPGSKQGNYRIISVPAALNNPDPQDVLEDDLGGYDKKKWRLFDCQDGNKASVEYPNTRDLTPGVGLFLIVKESGKTFDIEGGYWLETATYTIDLQRGWNLIGNPYNMEIPAEKIKLNSNDSLDQLVIYEYLGDWQDQSQIVPWHGYAIAVNGDATLKFDPFGRSGGRLGKTQNDWVQGAGWRIQICALSSDAKDEWNFAGVSEAAKPDRDRLDRFEPLVIGDYISLYFPHPEWQTFLTHYSTDYRSPMSDGYTWDFEIQSNLTDPAILKFSGIEDVPMSYEVWLVDEAAKVSQNLRNNNSYSIALSGEEHPRQLKLVVGNNAFIGAQVSEFQLVPDNYELSQNFPNPFNPSTTIRFGLPEAGKVTLKIYNLLGEEVVTLMNNEPRKAGYHVLIWNGRNKQGQMVANGMYVYQLQAGGISMSKKMALMK